MIFSAPKLLSQWSMTRIVRSSAPGTSTSTAPIKGTDSNPISRQAAAGKAAVKSGVDVKITEITELGVSELARMIAAMSSLTPSLIASTVFALIWVAPRTALIGMG